MSQETHRATIRLAKLPNAPTLKDLRALLETAQKNAGTNVELTWVVRGPRSYQLMARCDQDGGNLSWTMRVIDGFEAKRLWNSDTSNLDVVCQTACRLSGAPPPGNGRQGPNRTGSKGAAKQAQPDPGRGKVDGAADNQKSTPAAFEGVAKGEAAASPPPGWWQAPDMDISATGAAPATPQTAPDAAVTSEPLSGSIGSASSANGEPQSPHSGGAPDPAAASSGDAADKWARPAAEAAAADAPTVVTPLPPELLLDAVSEPSEADFLDDEIEAQYHIDDDETAAWQEQENDFGLTGEASGSAQFLCDQLIEQKVGLYTYPALLMLLEQEFYRFEANRTPVSLILFSMDHADDKPIPPYCVTTAALRIGLIKQRLDVLARFESSDFAILMPHTTATRAVLTASRALEALRASALAPGYDGKVMQYAFGVATLQENGSVESLIAAAKAAMKRAKHLICPIHVAR